MNIISLKNVSKTYKIKEKDSNKNWLKKLISPKYVQIKALKYIDIQIKAGDIVGIIGENGAGKSTIIKIMMGLLKTTTGVTSVLEVNPFDFRRTISKDIGVLMGQKSQLWWDLPLIDSFIFYKHIYEISDDKYEEMSEFLFNRLEVKSFLNQPVRQLSLGQRMRGELIASLLHNPKILFLDEPTLGLDIYTKKNMLEVLYYLNKKFNTTIILTTHEINEIEKICDSLLLLEKGEIIYDGLLTDYLKMTNNLIKIKCSNIEGFNLSGENFHILEQNKNTLEIIFNKDRISEKKVQEILKSNNIHEFEITNLDLESVLHLYKNGVDLR